MQTTPEKHNSATKVMLVEDEVVIAMDTQHQLEDFGYNVVANAFTGEQAIIEATQFKPEIVIMDIVLTGKMDGITAAQSITKELHIPVIFLTAYSDPETLRRAKASGASSYLIKPFRFAELHACIEVALHRHQMERKIRESEQWFAKTLHCISDAVIATDADGKIRFMNPVAEALTGATLENAQGKAVGEIMTLLTQENRELIENPVISALESYSVNKLGAVALLVSQSGQEFLVEDGAAPIMDENGALLGAVMVFKDITQRCEIENLLRDSEQRFYSAFDLAAIGMALVAVDGRYLQVNSSLTHILGYAKDELQTLSFHHLSPGDECRKMLEHQLHQVAVDALTLFPTEVQCFHKIVGKMVWVLISGSLVRNTDGEPQYFIIQVQDISERKAIEQQLTYIANHDALTGLMNRQQFHNRLTEALSYSRRHNTKLALVFLDLDRFKLINDTLGHWIGDLLIKAVAERLKKSFRTNDTLARLGGDEFIMLLSDIAHVEDVARIAQKTIDLLTKPFALEGNDIVVTASVGISVFPDDGDNGQTLMMNADSAMYLAKERGKNNYQFYTLAMTERSVERMTIERGLRNALTNHELKLYYQPQIDVTTGQTVSCEALVRWQQPDGEIMNPDRFIVIAEETGLIVPIGAWVMRTACFQAKVWQDNDSLIGRVAVNVSTRQFLEHDLYQMVKDVLNETGLNPSALELEITESAVMHDLERTLQLLQQLHKLGVRLSIDDFGIGYSSLTYLRKFPVHSVKIDRSFVKNIPVDNGSMALVRAVIALAHELELDVTAEGVETIEQLAFLKDHQCDKVQGYLFCQPATAAQLEKMFCTVATQNLMLGKSK
jgi:diguanylate cyclase (GGDEF)-like protein/PAS domain S-box-containing protein